MAEKELHSDQADDPSAGTGQVPRRRAAVEALRPAYDELDHRVAERSEKLRQTDDELRAEIASLAKFPDENPNPIIRVGGDGIVLYANAAAHEILQNLDSGAGRPIPADWRAWISQTVASQARQTFKMKHAERSYVCDLVPIPKGGYVNLYLRDITDRMKVEEALRKSEQFNRDVVAHVKEGIIVYDRDLRYVAWNPYMEELTGMSAEHALGKRALELFPKLLEYGVDRLLERALAGETVRTVDMSLYFPNTGKSGWFASSYGPYYDADGNIIGAIAAVHDVAERRRLEDELRRSYETLKTAQAYLVQSEKLAAMGRLVSAIAHEITNPLAIIQSSLCLLLDSALSQASQDQKEKKFSRHTKKIQDSLDRAREVIENLLGVVRCGSAEEFDLDALAILRRTLTLVRTGARVSDRRIVLAMEPIHNAKDIQRVATAAGANQCVSSMRVRGRAGQLEQVFLNLLQNSLDATIKGGCIMASYVEGERIVRMTIADDGAGIPAGNMQYLFEPFFSTKDVGEGTGLGLYVSHQVVVSMGGRIFCESQPGEGTLMHIELPGKAADQV